MADSPVSTDLKDRVAQVLATQVAPALQMDGGGIEVLDVSDGVVQVRVQALCGCCPSTIMGVVMSLEQELRQRIPEVEYLEVVP